MTSSLHPSELDNGATDSVASSPRSEHHQDLNLTRVRFMCSFGGKILPRPHDNQLRYVGGDTRIVAVHRSTTYSALLTRLSKIAGSNNISVKYQLPNEDLDALISVTTDEDVDNMIEEYDRIAQNQNPRSARLRLFLFTHDGEVSRTSSISSLLDGSTNREHWFLDALNTGGVPPPLGSGLERGRSEASSIISEVPDYFFGLDHSDEPTKLKARPVLNDNVSASDPGSPAPVVSSPFCSTSSANIVGVPSMPDLPPVKTKPDYNPVPVSRQSSDQVEGFTEMVQQQQQQQTAVYSGQPMWGYAPESHYSNAPPPPVQQMPVYYVPSPVQSGNAAPLQPVSIQPQQYVQQYPGHMGQIPVGYNQQVRGPGQVYGGMVRPVMTMDNPYDQTTMRVVSADGVNQQVQQQQVYYGVRNAGFVPGYPGMMMPGGEEMLQRTGSDTIPVRASQAP